jgi:hypothetical protein
MASYRCGPAAYSTVEGLVASWARPNYTFRIERPGIPEIVRRGEVGMRTISCETDLLFPVTVLFVVTPDGELPVFHDTVTKLQVFVNSPAYHHAFLISRVLEFDDLCICSLWTYYGGRRKTTESQVRAETREANVL